MNTRAWITLFLCGFLLFHLAAPLAAAELQVAKAPTEVCPLLVGSQLPDITLQDLEGNSFDLNRAIAEKPTILIYFRGGW